MAYGNIWMGMTLILWEKSYYTRKFSKHEMVKNRKVILPRNLLNQWTKHHFLNNFVLRGEWTVIRYFI